MIEAKSTLLRIPISRKCLEIDLPRLLSRMELRVVKPKIPPLLIIALISGTIFFTNLGGARLWDRDEPRNAGCALEMMERGNLVVPTFNDELRHQKPALLYWLIASAYSLFGVNEFSARFWSALLGIGTVCASYSVGVKLFNRNIAFLAAIALASSLMFVVAARAATPDSLLIFCCTVAMLIYANSVFSNPKITIEDRTWFPENRWSIVGFYSFLGLAVLAKGPIGFLMPMAIVGMFMLLMRMPTTERSRNQGWLSRGVSLLRPFQPRHFFKTLWAMKPLAGALIVLLLAAPWYIAVGAQTDGEWLRRFFLDENFGASDYNA